MIIHDPKKTASLILARIKGDGSEKTQEVKSEESMSDEHSEMNSFAEDLMQAMHEKSVSDLSKVLSALCDYILSKDAD